MRQEFAGQMSKRAGKLMKMRASFIIAAALIPLMMPSARAGVDEFREWQHDPRYQHSPATECTKRGDRFLEEGDTDQALPLYTKAIGLDKNFAPAYSNRAECLIDSARSKEAIDDLHRAIALEGTSAYHPMRLLGRLQLNSQHYAEALPVYEQLLKQSKSGKSDGLLEDRAQCYAKLGKLNLAVADYTEALKYAVRKDLPLYERALLYDRLHQYDKVIADCNEIINRYGTAISDRNVMVLTLRAQAHRKMGQASQAKKDLDRADIARRKADNETLLKMK